MPRKKIELTKEAIEQALKDNPSAHAASVALGQKYSTFKRRAVEYGIYVKNQGRKNFPRDHDTPLHEMVSLTSIKRLAIKRGILEDKCDECGIPPEWMGKPLVLQLEHINGNRGDNREENLRLLCPNCHTQTPTWGRRKSALVGELVDPPG